MAPSKTSRKGKKAWRKNIDSRQVEEGLEKHTQETRQGLVLDHVADQELFFVDKARDDTAVAAVASGKKRKRQAGKKLLKCQAILSSAQSSKPIYSMPALKKARKPVASTGPAPQAVASSAGALRPQQAERTNEDLPAADLWSDQSTQPGAPVQRRPGATEPARQLRAVEVDAPGCSYNPDSEHHQDAVAEAVAAEMSNQYKRDLEGQAPPAFVDYMPEEDDLAALQTPEGPEGEDEESEDTAGGQHAGKRHDKKTQAVRNRDLRRRAAQAEEEARRRLKQQRQDLTNLGQLQVELSSAEAARQARLARRAAVKADKMASEPPRLGKLRFTPAPVQVLSSDEVSGCLRKLKPAAALARDRFKSLQKRGVIEPRAPARSRQGRVISYQTGDRAARAQAGQDALHAGKRHAK